MKKLLRLLCSLVLVTIIACQPSTASQPSPANDSGLILYQTVDEEGHPKPELAVVDTGGSVLRRIVVPGLEGILHPSTTGSLFTTPYSHRALLLNLHSAAYYLVDADAGTAQKIELPREEVENLRPNPEGSFVGGKQSMILGVPFGWPGGCYLLNLETGQVKDLKAIDKEIQNVLGGRFSPDEAYLAFVADRGMWLVPTAHPDDARELGEGSVLIADFSSDSQQIAYVQRTKAGKMEIVLEDVNGSKSATVLASDVLNVRFVPGKQQLVAAKEGQLFLLDLSDRSQRELLAFQGNPIHFLFASSGGNMLFGHDSNGTLVWHLLDLEKGTAQSLDDLTGYVYPSSASRWLMFVDSPGTVANHRFFSLDLETGKTREILAFDDKTKSSPPRELSTDGRFGLVTAWGQDVQQLWLLDAEKSEARLLAESKSVVDGALSPNGQWVVVNTWERGDKGVKSDLVLIATEGEQTRSLGKGFGPVWVYP